MEHICDYPELHVDQEDTFSVLVTSAHLWNPEVQIFLHPSWQKW